MELVIDKRSFSRVENMLTRLPKDWQREEASMAIFRKASKPILVAGESQLAISVPELAMADDVQFRSKKDRTSTIMRSGLLAKGKGRLGHLFNYGTADRVQFSTGKSVGRIDKAKFGSGWFDRAKQIAMPQVEANIDKFAQATISRYVRKYK